MAYKISEIEGVGDVYAQKLNDAGIKTVDLSTKLHHR